MKTLVKLFFIAALLGLITGCNDLNETDDLASGLALKKGHVEPVTVTVPFKADLVGEYQAFYFPDEDEFNCEDGFGCRVIVKAEGNATHMGKVTAHFDFCACGETDIPNNEKYGPAEVCLTAANGDKLFFAVEGIIQYGQLDYHPEDVFSYWKDEYVIIGGTGRFEGATGTITTDDYNRESYYMEKSFHHWTGTIKMKKGKK